MATDTNILHLIVNKLTQAQYDSATKNPNELYLTPEEVPEIVGTTSGNNANFAIKFPDGLLICCAKQRFTNKNINSSWGDLYSIDINTSAMNDWAVPFTSTPVVCTTATGGTSSIIIGTYGNPSAAKPGGMTICRPTTATGVTIDVENIGIGFWK